MAVIRKSLSEVLASPVPSERIDPIPDEITEYVTGDIDTAPELTLEMFSDPVNLRRRLGMGQDSFAAALGVPPGTLRDWESGALPIDGAARSLLILIARDPEGTIQTLAAARAAA